MVAGGNGLAIIGKVGDDSWLRFRDPVDLLVRIVENAGFDDVKRYIPFTRRKGKSYAFF